MAFQQTSAADYNGLLAAIYSFAIAQGWTGVYNAISSKNQMGIEKGNCHLAMGTIRNNTDSADATTFTRNDLLNGGTVQDAYLVAALSASLTPGNTHYWGHPGSIVTAYNDTDYVQTNDLVGPFSNIWLYSDAAGSYIHCVIQSGADRFTHLSFGTLNKGGKTHPDVGYAVGQDWIWWPNQGTFTEPGYAPNDLGNSHTLGHNAEGGSAQLYLPDNVLDASLGFTDNGLCTSSLNPGWTRGNLKSDHITNSTSRINDYMLVYDNQIATGGVPLCAAPFIYTEAGLFCYIGDIPDFRWCNIANLNPAQEIKFGSEVWQVFPIKRKGSRANCRYGTDPQQYLNTVDMGMAYKKVV